MKNQIIKISNIVLSALIALSLIIVEIKKRFHLRFLSFNFIAIAVLIILALGLLALSVKSLLDSEKNTSLSKLSFILSFVLLGGIILLQYRVLDTFRPTNFALIIFIAINIVVVNWIEMTNNDKLIVKDSLGNIVSLEIISLITLLLFNITKMVTMDIFYVDSLLYISSILALLVFPALLISVRRLVQRNNQFPISKFVINFALIIFVIMLYGVVYNNYNDFMFEFNHLYYLFILALVVLDSVLFFVIKNNKVVENQTSISIRYQEMNNKVNHIKQLFENGLITDEEYIANTKIIVDNFVREELSHE